MIRHCLIAGISIGLVLVGVSAQPPVKPKESPAAKLAAEVKALAEELKEARETVKKITDKSLREKLELQISRAELRAAAIKEELNAMTGAAPAAKAALTDAEFQKLCKSLKDASFDKDKASIITAMKGISLNCEQLHQILKAFDFDDARLTAGVHLYPMLTDPGKIFTVYETFTFDSKKAAFREAIEKLKK